MRLTCVSDSEDHADELDRIRTEFQTTLGQVVSVLMTVPRYMELRFGDLVKRVVDPLSRGRIVIAAPKTAARRAAYPGGLSGILIWANVSRAVDRKIRRQIERGAYPILLEQSDWNSGQIHWLLDVIAPDADTAAIITRKHLETIEAHTLKMHPQVTALLGSEGLARVDLRRPSLQ